MATSERQKEYVRKHQEKTDEIKIRPPKGTKETWQREAAARGLSLQRFIINVVNAALPDRNTIDP